MGCDGKGSLLYNSSMRSVEIPHNCVVCFTSTQHGGKSFSASQCGGGECGEGLVFLLRYMSARYSRLR